MRLLKYSDFYQKNEGMISFSEITDSTYSNLRLSGIVKSDEINQDLLDDINTAAVAAGVKCFVTTGRSDHPSAEKAKSSSNHKKGMAVDVSRVGYATTDWNKILLNRGPQSENEQDPEYIDAGTKLAIELSKIGYGIITSDSSIKTFYTNNGLGSRLAGSEGQKGVIWRTMIGGNHYNHLHISRQLDAGDTSGSSNVSSADFKSSDQEPGIMKRISSFFGFGGDEEKSPVEAKEEKKSKSKIITSVKVTGKMPVIIIHNTKEIQQKIDDDMLNLFQSLLKNFVVVHPKESDITTEDLMIDIQSYLKDNGAELSSLSVIFFGKSALSKNLIDYSKMDVTKNILLINPPPSKTINNFIQTSKVKPYVAIDVETVKKLYGDKEVDSMISTYKEKLTELGVGVDNYIKTLTSNKLEEIIKSALVTFEPKMIKKVSDEETNK